MTRGYDDTLQDRVSRASGDHYALTPATLRWWDAFGGRVYAPDTRRRPGDVLVIVESVRDRYTPDYSPRTYHVRTFIFYRDRVTSGTMREHVTSDSVGFGLYTTPRAAQRLAVRVAAALAAVVPASTSSTDYLDERQADAARAAVLAVRADLEVTA